ncbi:MAG: formate dehydrogenase accessory sulfurtransferase FdhD [Chloroflexota bacterium]|nr:MAG: formate dehydrogenase accessory sulfurtransferase FdhD [Chloroflexota bacterium]
MKQDINIIHYHQFKSGSFELVSGEVIVESPLDLYVNGESWLTFMCTPNRQDSLAVGFLYNEGVVDSIKQVLDIHICESGEVADIWLDRKVEKPKEWKRTSGCTGGYTTADFKSGVPPISSKFSLYSNYVRHLVERLLESQNLYTKSGGVHTSILTDGEKFALSAEDVGRHNTLDKIAGMYLMDRVDVENKILLTTGRVSSDMLQKSARIGAAIVISRTSPTSMSIELAEKWGITLIGYARKDRFNLYTHPERILETDHKGIYHAYKLDSN